MGKVFKDKPISEIILRKFEKPINLDNKTLIRKFCISLGLLQPGDSRDVIVEILSVLIHASKENKVLSSAEINTLVKSNRTEGTAASNVRRQLFRLEKIGLIEKKSNKYHIRESLPLKEIVSNYIKHMIIEPILKRIEEYAEEIDNLS